MKQPEYSVSSILCQVTTLWQRGVKKALEAIEVTPPQSIILSSLIFLSKQKESVTQINLSLHSKMDPMTTSTIIRTLERKGFVKRKEHDTDTRAKAVVLTNQGMKIAKQAARLVEKFDNQFFNVLGSKTKTFNSSLLTLIKEK